MRIVFLAFANSVHAAKWISLVADRGWDLHVIPSALYEDTVHSFLRNVTIWSGSPLARSPDLHPTVVRSHFSLAGRGNRKAQWWSRRADRLTASDSNRAQWTADLIRHLKPDIVHSMEFQHAGALALAAKRCYGPGFPPWIATNWGSDVYLFGRLAAHREMVSDILQNCDYYSCECARDVTLARSRGLRGKVLPVVPNSGGLDFEACSVLRSSGPTSARRVIAVKGYHWTLHRAQVALRAIEISGHALQGYRIEVYSPLPPFMTDIQAELIERSTGLEVKLLPDIVPHEDILALHGRARISISLSISDGLCTSFAEAIAMGSFPIQSATACADEWISDGISGFLVPPEEPEVVADRIRRAATDDALVDRAAEINLRIARDRLDRERIRDIAVRDYYEYVWADYDREMRNPALVRRGDQ
jgi:glycosyltransferase involved in cell wall biosynthesis